MTSERKKAHIDLTFSSRPTNGIGHSYLKELNYEPLFGTHTDDESILETEFLGHKLKLPLWVSSMTGGTEMANKINSNLAQACGEFGLGMGLGSCRSLLGSDNRFSDFDVREKIAEYPLFTNFGIAQLEELINVGSLESVLGVNQSLKANGVIIHVNPLQEWAQPEGDKYQRPSIETIKTVLDELKCPIIVKEVGQGFGPESLRALCELPLAAIELSGFGGTNFTMIEQSRHGSESRHSGTSSGKKEALNTYVNNFGNLGHTVEDMIGYINSFDPEVMQCKNFILSGGITDPLQAYVYLQKINYNAVVGMASQFLKYSMGDYEVLQNYLDDFKAQFLMAKSFLKLRRP